MSTEPGLTPLGKILSVFVIIVNHVLIVNVRVQAPPVILAKA